MATIAGIFTSSIFLLIALNFFPNVDIKFSWQFLIVAIVATINIILWRKVKEPLSFKKAIYALFYGLTIIVCFGLIDIFLGYFVRNQKSLVSAFFHSGMFGGVFDFLLGCIYLFIGIPTLVRAVLLNSSKNT